MTDDAQHNAPENDAELTASAAPDAATPAAVAATKKKRSVAGIVGSPICRALVALLAFIAIWMFVDKFIRKSPVPTFMGVAVLNVQTGSMRGTIDEGDLIVIKRAKDYKENDIITFMPDGDTIPTTHRIIRIEGDKYYTKGDANNAEDTRPIVKSQIIGKYQFRIKYVGLFFRWVAQDGGWLYFAAIVVVIVVGVLLLKLYTKNDKTAAAGSAGDTAAAAPVPPEDKGDDKDKTKLE